MPRDFYETTIALPDATGVLKALSGVKVSVVPRGVQDLVGGLVDIFASDTGVTRGPDPKAGATGTNPLTTGASGSVRFWAEGPAQYDLVFEDTVAPARIADRVGWNAWPAKAGAIPTSSLALDGGITQKMLSADVIGQQVPIGAVIEWWRPVHDPIIQVPVGYEVAGGQPVSQHEFSGVTGSVILPNLQNVFILGATAGRGDGLASIANDLPTSGPGIGHVAGTNAPFNLAHTHGVPGVDHSHVAGSLVSPNHVHGPGTLYAQGNLPRLHTTIKQGTGGNPGDVPYASNQTLPVIGGTTAASGVLGVTGSTGGMNGGAAALNTNTNSLAWTANPGTDFRPRYFGLLRLIKVRRTV